MRNERPPLRRRDFLKGGAGVLAAASLAGGSLSCRTPSGGGTAACTRLGFTTYTWGKPWDVPTLIANCRQVGILGVELRTSQNYAHGLEMETPPAQRAEARRRFADSPVTLVGMACGERFDSPDPGKLRDALEKTKGYLRLSHDVGGSGLRVFPNDFHAEVPKEQTRAQIAHALNEVGAYAADYGQQVRLEAHGSAGGLADIRAIMDQVTAPNVRVKLNSSARDTEAPGLAAQFALVKDVLGDTLHLHDLNDPTFPYQEQMNLLVASGWTGWQLLEVSHKVPDRVAALAAYRRVWDALLAEALRA